MEVDFKVSVVIERMYDWSSDAVKSLAPFESFSCYWKNVRLKLWFRFSLMKFFPVSVVIERMYDWSISCIEKSDGLKRFSCYWKNVRLKLTFELSRPSDQSCFSCYWKNVRLKPKRHDYFTSALPVSVVIERMYDWSWILLRVYYQNYRFSCYWKNVRLKPEAENQYCIIRMVSVVIERMYDWSSETNWLKINDFWQLVSGLFFENGRSAQKVPLFSKIWGDCLTVFDSCGNI